MTTSQVVVAAAAVLGGVLWAVKSTAILVTGDQPAVTFEAAVVCFALATSALAWGLPTGRRRSVLVVVGLVGLACSVVALLSGERGEILLLPATLATLAVLTAAARDLGRCRPVALAIAVGTFPLFLVGGLLAVWDERLLEIPLLAVSLLWVGFGWCQWAARVRDARP